MTEDLEALSTKELHDRAFHRAERHLDVGFFWSLLKAVPAAETAGGDLGEGQADVQNPQALVLDALSSDESHMEALRPLYLDYLEKHRDA